MFHICCYYLPGRRINLVIVLLVRGSLIVLQLHLVIQIDPKIWRGPSKARDRQTLTWTGGWQSIVQFHPGHPVQPVIMCRLFLWHTHTHGWPDDECILKEWHIAHINCRKWGGFEKVKRTKERKENSPHIDMWMAWQKYQQQQRGKNYHGPRNGGKY